MKNNLSKVNPDEILLKARYLNHSIVSDLMQTSSEKRGTLSAAFHSALFGHRINKLIRQLNADLKIAPSQRRDQSFRNIILALQQHPSDKEMMQLHTTTMMRYLPMLEKIETRAEREHAGFFGRVKIYRAFPEERAAWAKRQQKFWTEAAPEILRLTKQIELDAGAETARLAALPPPNPKPH